MQFDIGIVEYIQEILGWAAPFFRIITELGSELFFIAIILTGYWAFKKRESMITTCVLILSLITNYWLKVAIANPRPDSSYWYPGYEEPNYSTPSGHAQNSVSLFGWITIKSKRYYVTIISFALILLIGISRVVLGVHYLEDVIIGWIIGFAILLILYFIEPYVTSFLEKKSDMVIYGTLFAIGLGALIITTLLFPPETIPGTDSFGAYGGLLMGLAISLPLEKRYVNFEINPQDRKRLILRVIIGLVFVIGLMLGLSYVLPSEILWMRTLRYLILAICGVLVWPAIFKRINL